jgi:hypothetical protein
MPKDAWHTCRGQEVRAFDDTGVGRSVWSCDNCSSNGLLGGLLFLYDAVVGFMECVDTLVFGAYED